MKGDFSRDICRVGSAIISKQNVIFPMTRLMTLIIWQTTVSNYGGRRDPVQKYG